MSTAIERIMRERGDLTCFHEPFMYDYYVQRKIRVMPHFDIQPDHPVTYQDVRDMLLDQARRGPVFLKDMSYYVMPHILSDKVFLDRIKHCFLIRDPVASIPSHYKLDPGVSCEEIGLEAQWDHYSGLKSAGFDPVVIEAESIRKDSKLAITELWRSVGLPYVAHAFDWQGDIPQDWAQVQGWHGDVSASTSIRPMDADELENRQRAFDDLAGKFPHLQDYLAHHRPFYDQLRAVSLVV